MAQLRENDNDALVWTRSYNHGLIISLYKTYFILVKRVYIRLLHNFLNSKVVLRKRSFLLPNIPQKLLGFHWISAPSMDPYLFLLYLAEINDMKGKIQTSYGIILLLNNHVITINRFSVGHPYHLR